MKNLPQNYQIKAEWCKRSFYYFLQEFWETIIQEKPSYNWHIEYLCNQLQNVAFKIKQRDNADADMVINVPPGSTKSTIISQMFPVWCWVIDPTIKLITGSHSLTLSTRDAVKSRDIIRSDKFQLYFPELQIKSDSDNKTRYETTKTGVRIATSVGSYITGEHAHILIADDPLNASEMPTQLQLQSANDWVDYLRSTRKINAEVSVFILLMQRLHEKDPSGHLIVDSKIKHICLPAILSDNVKPEELKEKYTNNLFDTTRLSEKILADKKKVLGSYGYAGQYLQSPAPIGGGILKREWFGTFTMDDLITRAKNKGVDLVWNYTVDGAYTADTSNDQSAILAYCMFQNEIYIRAVIGVWEELPDFIKTLTNFVVLNGYNSTSSIYVEPKATGLSIVQTIKRESYLNVIVDKAPNKDKVSRAMAVSPFIESRRVHLLSNGQGINELLLQCESFPNAKLKDMVDCLIMAIQRFQDNKGAILEMGFL